MSQSEPMIWEVKRDVIRGSVQGESLWWSRSAAVAETERLARDMAARSKRRILKRDDHDPERWNVLEADERWPDKPTVFVSYYVFGRFIHGTVVDRLAALS